MTPVAIIVPVLARPHRVAPLVASIEAATPGPHRTLFVASPDDDDELAAIAEAGVEVLVMPHPRAPGDWAAKVNAGYRATTEPLILLAADDLRFHPGWHEAVDAHARLGFGVIGTQDLGSPRVLAGTHSTHPVIARWYADRYGVIDRSGQVACEHYGHNWVDDELVETAKYRGMWSFAGNALIEHLHPSWGKAPTDDVYQLGRSTWDQDKATYRTRRVLWT